MLEPADLLKEAKAKRAAAEVLLQEARRLEKQAERATALAELETLAPDVLAEWRRMVKIVAERYRPKNVDALIEAVTRYYALHFKVLTPKGRQMLRAIVLVDGVPEPAVTAAARVAKV